jgi:hypothetical protein
MKGAQILIDAKREAHARDAVLGGHVRARPRAQKDAVGRGLCHANDHRLALVVQQAFEHSAAAAQHTVHAGTRQAKRPGRAHLNALLDAGHARALGALVAAAEQVHVDQQRTAADDLHELARATARPSTASASPEPAPGAATLRESTRVTLAPVDETDDGGAGDEASGRHGGCLHGGDRSRWPAARELRAVGVAEDGRLVREHGQCVDLLARLLLDVAAHAAKCKQSVRPHYSSRS